MTRQEFLKRVGRPPSGDDMKRANCKHAGTIGHLDCGVCKGCKLPRFLCVVHDRPDRLDRIRVPR